MAFKNYRKETSERSDEAPTGQKKFLLKKQGYFLIQLKVAMKIKITL